MRSGNIHIKAFIIVVYSLKSEIWNLKLFLFTKFNASIRDGYYFAGNKLDIHYYRIVVVVHDSINTAASSCLTNPLSYSGLIPGFIRGRPVHCYYRRLSWDSHCWNVNDSKKMVLHSYGPWTRTEWIYPIGSWSQCYIIILLQAVQRHNSWMLIVGAHRVISYQGKHDGVYYCQELKHIESCKCQRSTFLVIAFSLYKAEIGCYFSPCIRS